MGFKQMVEEARQNNEMPDSDELSQEQAWRLANRVIASEPDQSLRKRYRQNYRTLRKSLESELLDIVGDLDNIPLQTKNNISAFVDGVLDRLKSQQLYHLLENHTLVGVGGRFSSGKSSFLNAMFMSGSTLTLPEAQDATTSVPTFIIHGRTEESKAHLCNHLGSQINLKAQELTAISHSFNTRFGLSLSSFISFIDITSNQVPPNVIMLDTPGYSKADSDQLEAYSDFEKAYEQLRSVDYLIWAFDISNGTITDEDFKFIKEIAPRKQILILACKSDLKTESERNQIIDQARQDANERLSEFGCTIFDVVPFSARDPEQNGNSVERINTFLNIAQQDQLSRTSLVSRLQEQFKELDQLLVTEMQRCLNERNSIEKNMRETNKIFSLKLLVEIYRLRNEKQRHIFSKQNTIKYERSIKNLRAVINPSYKQPAHKPKAHS